MSDELVCMELWKNKWCNVKGEKCQGCLLELMVFFISDVPRSSNTKADELAKQGSSLSAESVFCS